MILGLKGLCFLRTSEDTCPSDIAFMCPETLPGHEEPCMLQFQGRYRFQSALNLQSSAFQVSPLSGSFQSEHVLALRVPGEIFWGTGKVRALEKVASHVVLVRNYFWSVFSENSGPLWAQGNLPD